MKRKPCFHSRPGSTMTEVIVAAFLLTTALSVTTPLVVKNGQIWKRTRHQQLAIDELSNQMERMLVASDAQRVEFLKQPEVSDQVAESLIDAQLTGEIIDDDQGRRLVLSLTWDRGVEALPLTLVGWLDAPSARETDVNDGEIE